MKNLWNNSDAEACGEDLLALRVYSSRLIGQDPNLVLHGGGNTSVKSSYTDLFGDHHEVLYVKGSGWDLETIEAEGFSPVRLDVLLRLARLPSLTDSDMVHAQRGALLNPSAPNPSVEAILHAIIPYRFVDHSHSDAVVTLTNTVQGEERIRSLYGNRVLIVPYVMPGFELAKKVAEMTLETDWSELQGMILMNHGLFTFSDDAKCSYDAMVQLVTEAELEIGTRTTPDVVATKLCTLELANLRSVVSHTAGFPMLARISQSDGSQDFTRRSNVADIATRGPLTPDHVIRTKRVPLIVEGDFTEALARYTQDYEDYFSRHSSDHHTRLDSAPRWAVWPGQGIVSFGRSLKDLHVVGDIVEHTCSAIADGEYLGGWRALPAEDIFAVEYWELEQAKLKKSGTSLPFQGKIAMVTGAASGIGRACVESLVEGGAVVAALDIDADVAGMYSGTNILGLRCDVTDGLAIKNAVDTTVQQFGGLDIVVSNAGIFTAGATIDNLDDADWARSLDVNLTAAMRVLRASVDYLKYGIDSAVVIVGSKNVPAPGPGAAAYSAAKAGLTQLARVAALELAPHGIRVNTVHPNAVFDTAIWTEEVLAGRAAHYGLTVSDYKTSNLLTQEVRSKDVAAMVCAMAGPDFSRTTGAQVPVDGGTERIV
ncbi:MAG: bifunctional aldolase/short-chain dehydrogenase [Pseudomonadota bacterium]|nr:bifunctional aldolase/short-chain dehydrogenase [Pseudomonadota bacterium]